MNRLYATMGFVAICLLLWTAPLYAAPKVDGFSGVPWGASQEQIKAAMMKKGFTLLGQKKDSFYKFDRYKGTFAGFPAELTFYYEKNIFYRGAANILNVLNSNSRQQFEAYYNDIKRLFIAKYGAPNEDSELSDGKGNWIGYFAKWNDLPAVANPPGLVKTYIGCGRGAIWDEIEQRISSGLCINFSIGEAWARLKATGGGI